ncbi:CHAP domain-containing protein [Marichromatium gracile]|uniref:peptidoglycan-binding protein n=1 Tax=Marichromatium gracile TaxID=1048 RepID=UPI001F355A9A|nr:peptidoglycan-binding protein [Marichromatium gracile]MCF1182329.1 CHAP domain-containing protein [Marichromatium gracile]
MSTPIRLEALREEYTRLFNSCTIAPDRAGAVERLATRILAQQERYRALGAIAAVPWPVIAVIHALESGLRFDRHLHNGDPLHARTRRVPAGRPPGEPPFSWERSALDALHLSGLAGWHDWGLAGTLFRLEAYNGWGYRKYHPEVRSPYLWSFSGHYGKGKYAADGRFDPELVSRQCGAATLLKALEAHGVEVFDEPATAETTGAPATLDYPGVMLRQGVRDSALVRRVQRRLNALGCAVPALVIDGDFGSKTEAALRLFQARSEDPRGEPLVVDGILGPLTWAALFGAEPPRRRAADRLLTQVLEIARSEIGVREDPLGSNRGPRVEAYLASTGLDGGHPWCAAFVHWCFAEAARGLGIDNPCINTAGVLDHWNRAGHEGVRRITQAEASADPARIQPGAIFVIDTGDPGGAGHTGLVERIEGARLVTIEGNTNVAGGREGIGVLRRHGRKINSINKGFIDYASNG